MTEAFAYRELIKNLVLKDLKLKYRDSTLGFLWSLVNPLLTILVYSFVFSQVLRVGIRDFPYFLMVGILPWNFFAQSLVMSTGAILDNGSLIRKVRFPAEVFPIATVLFNLAQYFLALAVFLSVAMVFFQVYLAWSVMALFVVLALQVLFTLGLSLMVSTATVFYRDVRHFTEIFLALLFWLTPVVYDIQTFPDSLRMAIYMNPITLFILSYQDALYRQVFPGLDRLLALLLLSLLSLMAGYFVFHKYSGRFAEEV